MEPLTRNTVRRALFGLAGCVIVAATVYVLAKRESLVAPSAAADFIGREQCVSCHEDAYQAWARSDHDHAMDVATDSTVLGDFDDAVFVQSGVESLFYRRDGGYFVYTEGVGGEMAEFEITHTFGWEPLQQYLVPFPGGRMQALPIAWDTERNEWFHLYPGQDISPDDWLHWTNGAQTWNSMCAECHSTNLVKGFDVDGETYETTWSEIDVSCEACHGPGSGHVAWAEVPEANRPAWDDFGLEVQTDALAASDFVGLCAPCHARRSEIADYDHRDRPLLDHILPTVLREGLYHPDGQILEEVYVYGSFLQSRMHKNQVRCADCHDSHSLELKADGNALCAQCHLAATYDDASHHYHEAEPPQAGASARSTSRGAAGGDGTRCVQCHMVEQPFMVVDWRADHSIRIPRPDLTADIGVPNACAQSGCHDDRPLSYVLDAFDAWYGTEREPHYGQVFAAAREGEGDMTDLLSIASDTVAAGIVRATALTLLAPYPPTQTRSAFASALSDDDALLRHTAVANVRALSPDDLLAVLAPLLSDSVRAVRVEAASRLADTPPLLLSPEEGAALASTLEEYRAAMSHSLDFAASAYNLGNLSARLGDPLGAERYYRSAGDIDDRFVPAKVNLALLLNTTGRNGEAEEQLRQVLEIEPDGYGVAYNLGLLLAEMGRVDEAVEFLGRASAGSLEPARVHYNYALALQQLEHMEEAEQAFLRALSVETDNADFLFALGDHYLQRGANQAALDVADRLIEAAPQDPRGPGLRAAIPSQP